MSEENFLERLELVVWDINKIHENLFQGAMPPKGELTAQKGFDVLVLCADENQDHEKYLGVQVICAPGDDDIRPNRLARDLLVWKPAAAQVAAAIREGKKVLVTCMAGLNRSGVVTALALQELTGWSGARVVKHIKSRRPYALCNDTFAAYIEETFPEEKSSQ